MENDFLERERKKVEEYQYLLNLQEKLRKGIIKEEEIDEEDYVQLEKLYQEQIGQQMRKNKKMKG